MKSFSKHININFVWTRADGLDIRPEHQEGLEESALERIKNMTSNGFTSGELSDNVRIDQKDDEDGIEYKGWWAAESLTPEEDAKSRKARDLEKIQNDEQFTTEVPKTFGNKEIKLPVCLLCANNDPVIHLPTRQTSWGVELPPVTVFCICPNGQKARRMQTEQDATKNEP